MEKGTCRNTAVCRGGRGRLCGPSAAVCWEADWARYGGIKLQGKVLGPGVLLRVWGWHAAGWLEGWTGGNSGLGDSSTSGRVSF